MEMKRRRGDKPWFGKPDWLKTNEEKEAEREAAKKAEALLRQCSANLALMADKYEELQARLKELDAMLKK